MTVIEHNLIAGRCPTDTSFRLPPTGPSRRTTIACSAPPNDALAEFFAVSSRTIDRWIAEHADFAAAVWNGRVVADAKMARSPYTSGIGYDREVVLGGELKSITSTVHYPANVQACIVWLRNRR